MLNNNTHRQLSIGGEIIGLGGKISVRLRGKKSRLEEKKKKNAAGEKNFSPPN